MATNVNVTEPPEFLKSYYAALAERGMNMGNLGFTPYEQNRVAPWNQQQQDAASMVQARAVNGSQAMDSASNWYNDMLAGKKAISPVQSGGNAQAGTNPYLGQNNPYLNNAINQAMGDVTSRIDSKFNNNAFGGTAHQQTLARELGNVSNNMRMQDYTQQQGLAENDVNRNLQTQQFNIGNQNAMNQFNANLGMSNIDRQQSAMAFAPTLAANDYADAQALMGVGNQLQQNNQMIADANYQEFLRKQQFPEKQLGYMAAGLAPSTSAFNTTTGTASGNSGSSFANAVGGATLGYGAASGLGFSNPWLGAAAGGLLGGMM